VRVQSVDTISKTAQNGAEKDADPQNTKVNASKSDEKSRDAGATTKDSSARNLGGDQIRDGQAQATSKCDSESKAESEDKNRNNGWGR